MTRFWKKKRIGTHQFLLDEFSSKLFSSYPGHLPIRVNEDLWVVSDVQGSLNYSGWLTCIEIAWSQSTLWKRSWCRSLLLWLNWRTVCLCWHTPKFCCLSLHVVTHLLFILNNFLSIWFGLCWTWCCWCSRIRDRDFWNTFKSTRIVTQSIALTWELRICNWLSGTWIEIFMWKKSPL